MSQGAVIDGMQKMAGQIDQDGWIDDATLPRSAETQENDSFMNMVRK